MVISDDDDYSGKSILIGGVEVAWCSHQTRCSACLKCLLGPPPHDDDDEGNDDDSQNYPPWSKDYLQCFPLERKYLSMKPIVHHHEDCSHISCKSGKGKLLMRTRVYLSSVGKETSIAGKTCSTEEKVLICRDPRESWSGLSRHHCFLPR